MMIRQPGTGSLHLLGVLAWINLVVHLAALALSAMLIAPGSPLMALDQRVDYVAKQPLGWSLGWGAWMVCGMALIAFLAALAAQLPERPDLVRLAVVLATAGLAIDLFCDVIYITVMPMLAARDPPDMAGFRLVERAANAGGLIVANGLYSIGILLLNLGLRARSPAAPFTVFTGYGVFATGMLLVVVGFLDSAQLAALVTGPTMGIFCLWTFLVARLFLGTESKG